MADVHISSTKQELQSKIGDFIAVKAKEAIEDHGYFSVAFSGGSIATIVPESLLVLSENLQFEKWRIFFCDERYVDLTQDDSNYNTVQKNFISKVDGIKAENVFKINPNVRLEDAATDYETKLTSSLGNEPKIDLLLIGMGPDGHICSLFPGHQLLEVKDRLVAPISDSPKPPSQRITLTFKAINNSKCAMFIASGNSKAESVQRVLEQAETILLPAARVKLHNGTVHWFLDEEAASQLKNHYS